MPRTSFADIQLMNLVVQAAIQKISDTDSKVKKIVEYFQRSTTGLDKLKSIQKQMNMDELKLKQDDGTRWNSTYDMLDRVARVKEALIATLALVRADLAKSIEDWAIIETAIPILKIFYEVTVEVLTANHLISYCENCSNSMSINEELED